MCFQCAGGWPWAQTVHLAPPPPVKEEEIYLDENPQFYPDYREGVHPPAPVYTSNQPADSPWYYYGNQPPLSPQMYTANTQFMSTAVPGMNPMMSGFPGMMPSMAPGVGMGAMGMGMMPGMGMYSSMGMGIGMCAATAAAGAAAANAALGNMPAAPSYFAGTNPQDVYAQQAYLAQIYPAFAQSFGGMGNIQFNPWAGMVPKSAPTQFAPYKPADGAQFWCKEIDGSWTLRTQNDIVMGEVNPGRWERHASSGYFYWVRLSPGVP